MKKSLRNCGFIAALCIAALTQGTLLSSCERPETNAPSSILRGSKPSFATSVNGFTELDTLIRTMRITTYTSNTANTSGSFLSSINGLGNVSFTRSVAGDKITYLYSGGTFDGAAKVVIVTTTNASSITYYHAADLATVTAANTGGTLMADFNDGYYMLDVSKNTVVISDFLTSLAQIHEKAVDRYGKGPIAADASAQVESGDPKNPTKDAFVFYGNAKDANVLAQRLYNAAKMRCDLAGMTLLIDGIHTWPVANGTFTGYVHYACYKESTNQYMY